MINKKLNPIAETLYQYMNTIPVIDTHEHLGEKECQRIGQPIDFMTLFTGYAYLDLIGAGISGQTMEALTGCEVTEDEKWAMFEPYYKLIKNGSYARAVRKSMGRFYGRDDLKSIEDVREVNRRIKEENKAGLYKKVMEACNIECVLNFVDRYATDDFDFYRFVETMNWYVELADLNQLEICARGMGATSRPLTLDAYVQLLRGYVMRLKEEGVVGLKFLTAYNRELHYENGDKVEAERIYDRYFDESYGFRNYSLGFEETIPLQDYLSRKIFEFAGEADLPVIFHSGIHGTGHRQENSRPLRLWNIFHKYAGTRFVLLHAGIPWIDEAATLAKNFPNVWLDMTWDHIISTEISKKAVALWVDMVPQNKVFGFGGDYSVVEDIYGHLDLAKENIARGLEVKVLDGALDVEEAKNWAKAMLYDNPKAFYGL